LGVAHGRTTKQEQPGYPGGARGRTHQAGAGYRFREWVLPGDSEPGDFAGSKEGATVMGSLCQDQFPIIVYWLISIRKQNRTQNRQKV
jgi:hypothetical protein